MAMLSDKELRILAEKEGFLTPFITDNCEGATINLTLDPKIKKYTSTEAIVLGKEVTEDHYKTYDLETEDFWLEPKESVLIQTHEFIKIPDNMSARIYERYGIKSLSLMISPAHYMNPGFRGNITLVAINHSSVPIKLVPGIKICQVGMYELTSKSEKPYDKQDALYMDSKEVSISKLHLDKDIQQFLSKKGVPKVSDELAKDLGDHLMSHIRKAANDLADMAREKIAKGELVNE